MVEASIRCQLGEVYLRALASQSAVLEYRRAIALLVPLMPPSDADLLACQFGLAQALAIGYQPKEAESTLVSAESAGQSALRGGVSGLSVAALRARLQVLLDSERLALALPVAQRLVETVDAWQGSDLADRFEARQQLSEVYLRLNDLDRGSAVLDQIMLAPYAPSSVGEVTFARARLAQARLLQAQGKVDSARVVMEAALVTLTEVLGPTAYLVGLVNYELGNLHSIQSDGERSYQCLTRALAAFVVALGEEHGYSMSIRLNIAILDVGNGRPQKGLEAFNALTPRLRALGRETDAVDFHRVRALNDLGRFSEALTALASIDPERADWAHQVANQGTRWKAQAERGRALIGMGQRTEGVSLVRAAVAEMRNEGIAPDNVKHYEKFARR